MKEYYFKEREIFYKTNKLEKNRLTLLFVHGLSGSSSAWIKYEEKFQQNYNIVSLDLRGHGKSAKKRKLIDYALPEFSQDIYLLIKFLHLNNIIFISHSFGTLIAQHFLSRYPDIVQAAIFLSPNFNVGKEPRTKALKYFLKLFFFLEWLPWPMPKGKHLDYNRYLHTGDWNIRRLLADTKNTGVRVFYYCTRQSYELHTEKILSTLRLPALVIHGKKDSIFPVANSLAMSKMLKNADLKILDQADHILVLNYFAEVSSAIEKFLQEKI